MITILVDHDIEGQARLLWATLSEFGWPELLPLRFVNFAQVGLPNNSRDREVWRFAQQHSLILLTGNRQMKESDSLEQTLRDENHAAALPVITISNVSRMVERVYRKRCAEQLLEILLYIDNYLGSSRLFIP